MSASKDENTPQRAPSPLDIANALAWILEHADRFHADGSEPQRAIDRAVQDHEAVVFEAAERAAVSVGRVARMVWAFLPADHDAHVLAWILARAEDFRGDGYGRREALEQAIAEHGTAWAEVTQQASDAAGRVARRAWALARTGGGGTRAVVAAVDGILERALVLHEAGHGPAEAMAEALNEHEASEALASVAIAAWGLALGGEAFDVYGPAAKGSA